MLRDFTCSLECYSARESVARYRRGRDLRSRWRLTVFRGRRGSIVVGKEHLLNNKTIQDAQLSQRDRAAGCVIVLAKSGRLELGGNVLQTL